MRDRHDWIVLTLEPANLRGVTVAVVVTTATAGAGVAGLTFPVSGNGVTGVAVRTHLRSVELHSRLADGSARLAGVADPATADEIAARVASLIDPEAGDRDRPTVYTRAPRRYHPAPHLTRVNPHQMRAEIEQLSDAAKQSIGLLRRHL